MGRKKNIQYSVQNIQCSFFLAVSMLLNKMDISSSVSFKSYFFIHTFLPEH